jgi:Kelch motif
MADRVAEAFRALDQLDPPVSWDDVIARGEAGRRDEITVIPDPRASRSARSTRRRRTSILAAAAVLLVALVVVLSTRSESPTDPSRVSATGGSPATTPPPTPTTEPATRSSRTFPVSVWTGDSYFVWSGEAGQYESSARADGWMYNPTTGRTVDVPTAPIAPRTEAVGVWTGREVIVCCGRSIGTGASYDTATAAAFRPDTGTWRRLADPPTGSDRGFGAAVWTGTEMIVVFGTSESDSPIAYSYNPDADAWRQLASPPTSVARIPEAAWTGTEVIVWSGADHGQGTDTGYRYDPATNTWSELPVMPAASATNQGSIAWTGDELVVYGMSASDDTQATGARWQPGDTTWRPISGSGLAPIHWYDGTPGSQTLEWDDARQRLMVWPPNGGPGLSTTPPLLEYNPARDTWRRFGIEDLGYHPDLLAHDGWLLRPDRDHPVITGERLAPVSG